MPFRRSERSAEQPSRRETIARDCDGYPSDLTESRHRHSIPQNASGEVQQTEYGVRALGEDEHIQWRKT